MKVMEIKIRQWAIHIASLITGLVVLGFANSTLAASENTVDVYTRGVVMAVENSEQTLELEEPLLTETLRVKITHGEEAGKEISVSHQVRGQDFAQKIMRPGDAVVVVKTTTPDQQTDYFITEPFRLPAVMWLLIIFFLVTIVAAGKRGLFAFAGLITTLGIIGWYIIPQISQGANPFIVCLVGAALIAGTSLVLGHGFNKNTALALVSIVITIIGALGLSVVFVSFARLFGLGSEEAYYLQFGLERSINLRGLLLGGIIIGVLGVLDDVATAQVAAVSELYAANSTLGSKELYIRASRIGREHIVAVVNTLVLAYVGAAFPLVLMFQVFTTPWWVTLNTELVTEEVLRTLIGSIALVAAVPITTAIAVWYYHRQTK